MSKLTIEIEMDNAAFDNNKAGEAWRILKELSSSCKLNQICQLKQDVSLFDINGNKVGKAEVM